VAVDASAPDVQVDGHGNAMATWFQPAGIYASRYVNGTGWGTPTRVSSADSIGTGASLAMNANGDAFAVWGQTIATYSDPSDQYPTLRFLVWGSRYTVSGGWEADRLLQSPTGYNSFNPQIAIDANGNALAAWSEYNGAMLKRIYTTRYRVGSGWGPRVLIDQPIAGDTSGSNDVQLQIDAAGNAFAVWQQLGNDQAGEKRIWVNRFQ
jgi:hypothetical protein